MSKQSRKTIKTVLFGKYYGASNNTIEKMLDDEEDKCPKCDYSPIQDWFICCPMCVHYFSKK